MTGSSVTPADQQFLAHLVHRGFLDRDLARTALEAAAEIGLDEALIALMECEPSYMSFLRRTDAMHTLEVPGYQFVEPLGEGGTAWVYGMQRKKDFKKVALKVLQPKFAGDSFAVKNFIEEGKLIQGLEIDRVVKGHRTFKYAGTYVIEMDWVPGHTLEELLDDGKTLPENEALELVIATAQVLEEMRAAGVQHRDLKPGNLMLDDTGNFMLIDLGFAGAGMEGRADTESTLGTPAYLAPEQASGDDALDVRADIYSLGATLYHLVLGKLPFEASDDQEMLRKQILMSLDGSSLKGSSISPSLHFFIEKMMAKDREVRYATPADLVEDVQAHLAAQGGLGSRA